MYMYIYIYIYRGYGPAFIMPHSVFLPLSLLIRMALSEGLPVSLTTCN